jgi:hypothetical protein
LFAAFLEIMTLCSEAGIRQVAEVEVEARRPRADPAALASEIDVVRSACQRVLAAAARGDGRKRMSTLRRLPTAGAAVREGDRLKSGAMPKSAPRGWCP